MNISLSIYRATIGPFSAKSLCISNAKMTTKLVFLLLTTLILVINLFHTLFVSSCLLATPSQHRYCNHKTPLLPIRIHKCLLFICWLYTFSLINKVLLIIGGVETQPGPKSPPKFSFATFNIDSILARDGCKLAVIESIDSLYKFDLFGICESYLTDSISNSEIKLSGFSPDPLRSDCKQQDGRPRGGVLLYFKDHIPIKHRPDLEIIDECIVAELRIKNKKIFYILSYRSPSQTAQTFSDFMDKLQVLLDGIAKENPFSIILTGDFNARSHLFWEDESIDTPEGKSLSTLTILNGFEQIIKQPTHFPRPGIETCIDHIFTNQPETIIDSGVIPSPDPLCKHSIVYGKINLNVPSPPPYVRQMWDYNKADANMIRSSFSTIDWIGTFKDLSPDQMVEIFNTKFFEIMNSFIPNRKITVRESDAPWITPEVKSALRKNKRVFKKWVNRGRSLEGRALVSQTQRETNKIINDRKNRYASELGDKICNPKTGPKCFWTAFKKLLNNKKVSNIPPLTESDKYISNFKEKANIFNDYFAQQCRPLDTDSVLPPLSYKTPNFLSDFRIEKDKIIEIIHKLNSNKAHGYDGLSIAMLKLCSIEVSLPLSLIFRAGLDTGIFPSQWKRANVQPVHKKNSRQIKSNYRPISLLPICSKIFEKVIYDSMYTFFRENNLISKNQSGFIPGDSTINQLLAITTEIFNAFEDVDETRAVFLDISKAFDKVWHEGLIFKLRQNGINNNLLLLITSFLSNRKQRVVLNGIQSDWQNIYSGVPQGSVLGPLLFLIYINDLSDNINSNIKLFADDSSLFIKVRNIEEAQNLLTSDLNTVSLWANQWKMQFNPDITKQAIEVIFSSKYKKVFHPPLVFGGIPVAREKSTKHLGFYLDEKLSFKIHITESIKKAMKGISLLKFLTRYLDRSKLDITYKLYVRPHLEKGDVIFHQRSSELMKAIESVQYQAGLIVAGCWKGTSKFKLYSELGWESLAERRTFHRLSLYYKILNNKSPPYLREFVLDSPPSGTLRYKNTFFPFCFSHWNDLSHPVKNSDSISVFKSKYIKTIRPPKRNFFGIIDRKGIPLLTRMRVEFSDLRDHRFNHNFNCITPTCKCEMEYESNEHFLLRCPNHTSLRTILLSNIAIAVNDEILNLPPDHLTQILIFGSPSFNDITNRRILEITIHFIKSSGRFNKIEAYSQVAIQSTSTLTHKVPYSV